MQNFDIKSISITSKEYCGRFKELSDPPETIYAAGNLALLDTKTILAIVGTRDITDYGRLVSADLARMATRCSVPVMSGLAIGVDAIAQDAALQAGGKVIAVLPGSLSAVYPRRHQRLAERIYKEGGLLLSEYLDTESPNKYQFVERNRLIAALCTHLIVPEASDKSGSFHTVNFALDLGRTVGCVPGNITSRQSKGANLWIKQGAEPITDINSLPEFLGVDPATRRPAYRPGSPSEAAIITPLTLEPMPQASLLAASCLDIQEFQTALTHLELRGIIEKSGSLWKLI